MTEDKFNELKDVIARTFPEIQITNFGILGSGYAAYACAVNNSIVFKVPKSNDDAHTKDHIKEATVLKHLENKLSFETPKILYQRKSESGLYIIGENLMRGITYTQELHDSFDENTKSKMLQSIGKIVRELHDATTDMSWWHGSVKTYTDSLNTFNENLTSVRDVLPPQLLQGVLNTAENYQRISTNFPVRPVLCHGDLHFANFMFDKDTNSICGLLDLGTAHYAEPARDFHYYYGDGARDILLGYGDNGDPYMPQRQVFYSTTHMLGNIKNDLKYNQSPERNINKLGKCLLGK